MRKKYQTFKSVKIMPGSVRVKNNELRFKLDMRNAQEGVFKKSDGGMPQFISLGNAKVAGRALVYRKFKQSRSARKSLSAFRAYALAISRANQACFIQGILNGHPTKSKNLKIDFGCLS